MEFFIPGLLLFVFAVLVAFFIVPTATPLITAVLSLIFLTCGVYQHYELFASEYRQSTWQDGLKIYAPAIMISGIVIFIIYGILGFFTNGSVPIPSLPVVNIPVNAMANTINDAKESITNTVNTMANTISNTASSLFNTNTHNNTHNNVEFT